MPVEGVGGHVLSGVPFACCLVAKERDVLRSPWANMQPALPLLVIGQLDMSHAS